MRFNVTIIKPWGYRFSEAFREVGETLAAGLCEVGHEAELVINRFRRDATNLVLGAHLLDAAPPQSIVYNLEQKGSKAFNKLARICEGSCIWDYSERNVEEWRKLEMFAVHVPLGYVPMLTRIPQLPNQDIDVLFYGSVNPRRREILDELRERGLKVVGAFGAYGEKRDKLIARAKVVLNMHFYDTKIFEIVRVSYLLANQRCVVSETSVDVPSGLHDAAVEAAYDNLARCCEELVGNVGLRETRARQGFEAFQRISERDILDRAITDTWGKQTAA